MTPSGFSAPFVQLTITRPLSGMFCSLLGWWWFRPRGWGERYSIRRTLTVTVAAGVCALAPPPASATWPGANGRIAFGTLSEHGAELRTSTLDGHRERVLARFAPLPLGL